jgi:hypothetical protein
MLEIEPKGFKYIVTTTFTENLGQAGRADMACHWEDTDAACQEIFSNVSLVKLGPTRPAGADIRMASSSCASHTPCASSKPRAGEPASQTHLPHSQLSIVLVT